MNSKSVNAKAPAKRDRPRSTEKQRNKGKRDGTPEKSGSPSNEMFSEDENMPPAPDRKHVIVDEDILKLAIKHDDLNKLRDGRPSSGERRTPPNMDVMVRKSRLISEWDKSKPRSVPVARPAPPDAPLQPLTSLAATGPRFDEHGVILPHSILGSVENFVEEGTNAGEIPADIGQLQLSHLLPARLGEKYGKKSGKPQHPKMESVEESNALKNWQVRMAERRRQQGYLSKLLGKPPDHLVMNQADTYRQTQEIRYLIDRAIPTMDYGKGYRASSEFWQQHEALGDDIGGLHVTPGQTDKGYPPPIEHIGVPKTVLQEKGSSLFRPLSANRKPWQKTEYLHQRKSQLQPVMSELDSHRPDLLNLEIVGTTKRQPDSSGSCDIEIYQQQHNNEDAMNEEICDEEDSLEDPLSCYPDVHPEPVFGPSITFAGQPARWTGDSSQFKDQVGIEARITFEAYETRRTTSHLEVTNDGTTCIYYNWEKLPKSNPFDVVYANVQRFYFDNDDGVILPGDTKKFPFVFKSPNAGVFTEQWVFQTHPRVYGGAALLVTLRGVALQEDKFKSVRSDLEVELAKRQAVQIVTNVLHDLIYGIRTPERPSSPLDSYITEQEIFTHKNANLKYHNETINDLHNLYISLFPDDEENFSTWDFDISSLKLHILSMDEDDDRKQEFLHKLNQAVANLSFPAFSPVQEHMYSVCYHMLVVAVDKMTDGCQKTRSMLGLPDPDETASPDEPSETKKSTNVKSGKAEAKDSKDKKSSGKKEDKQPPKTPAKDASPKGGKITPSAASQKRRTSKQSPSDDKVDRVASPGQERTPSPIRTPSIDPVLQHKYKDKLYAHTYSVLGEFLDQVSEAFAEIENQMGGTAPGGFGTSRKLPNSAQASGSNM